MTRYFVSGDIGGTKTLLQATESKDGTTRLRYEHRYPSRAYSSFSDVFGDFLNEAARAGIGSPPTAACFAVAGPITQQTVSLTNLPWLMDGAAIAKEFSIPAVKLINDFAAVAASIEILSASDLVTLQTGKPCAGERRVALGAGTGMGGAWLIWQGDRYVPLPSEAGHMDFAPADELQARLLQHLRGKFGHVSVERVLSGPGLSNIFNFLSGSDFPDVPGLRQAGAHDLGQVGLDEDGAARVTDLAFNHNHSTALKAVDLFVSVYGAYAGNLALAGLSRNGVYVAGGIAPKIIDKLREGSFMKAFRDKGRFSALMEEMPVHVVMNSEAGLIGAAAEAERLLHNKC